VRIAVAALILVGLAVAGSARPAPALRTCRTAQLHVWVTHTGAGLGTVGGYLAFTNRGPECSMHGWPTLTALRPGVSTVAVRVHATMFGPYVGGTGAYVRRVPTVRLRHGETAVAAFTAGDNPRPGHVTCPPSYRRLRVTPPGHTNGAVIKAWIAYYGHNLPSCTRIELSMVVPASDMPPRG
jgi:hypothetical protein